MNNQIPGQKITHEAVVDTKTQTWNAPKISVLEIASTEITGPGPGGDFMGLS